MTTHSSAGTREHTPHANQTTRTATIVNALTRRARAVLNDKSIDAKSRAVIRYALEMNDPWLAELVRRADAGERRLDTIEFSQTPESIGDQPDQERVETLAEMICRGGNEPTAALLVLMATLENAAHPKALANQAKHLAFARCADSNLYNVVDAQIAFVEGELLANNAVVS